MSEIFVTRDTKRSKKFSDPAQALGSAKTYIIDGEKFDIFVPKIMGSFIKDLSQFADETGIRLEIEPGSDPSAIACLGCSIVGASLGAIQGAVYTTTILKGLAEAGLIYTKGGGAVDGFVPGAGVTLAIGTGLFATAGAIIGWNAAKYKVHFSFKSPVPDMISAKKENYIFISFKPA